MSPASDSTLADPQQIITGLQRQLADAQRRLEERAAERDEALARETATAEVLGVINLSPGDLAPVFAAMLDRATSLCEAAFGVLWIIDGERIRAVATHNVPSSYRDFLEREAASSPGPSSGVAQTIRAKSPLLFADAAAGDAYQSGDPFAVAAVELGGVRTLLNAPLAKDDAVLGILAVYRKEVRPFSEKQIALLQAFAAQAVIAMENARLITETHEALEQQTATAEVLGVINSSLGDLAPVFDAMLARATRLCGASCGNLFAYDGEVLQTVAAHGDTRLVELLRQVGAFRPGSHIERLLKDEPFLSINDATKEDSYRRYVAVPLRKDDRLLGFIAVYREEERPYTERQIALLQDFAAQAVIAMENARLITETREALEQQTATAEVLQVINSSPGNLTPVFDAMLEKAMHLCGFDHGSLQTYDGQLFRAVAVRGLPEQLAEQLRAGYRPELWPPTRPLVDGARLVHIPDLTQEEQADGVRLAVASGSRTLLFAPLRKDEALLGTIVAVRQEVRPFGEKEIALLQNFAAQAVIAMENARLINETREALEQQTATSEILQVINSSPGNLVPVFEAMLDKTMRLCEASFGAFMSFDGALFHRTAHRGLPAELVEEDEPLPPLRGGAFARIVSGEGIVHVDDLADTEFYRSGNRGFARLIERGGARTAIWMALRKDDALLGAAVIYRQEVRPFSDKQIALLQNFAAQAVIAMENARLITETREALEQQTATAEVLGVINSSPGDLAPVFDAMLEKAMRLCEASGGALRSYDGKAFHAAAMRSVPTAFVEATQDLAPYPETALGRIERGAHIIQVPDLTDPKLSQANARRRRELLDLGHIGTALWVALRKDEALLGAFVLYRDRVQPFTDKQVALVENFAAQAVIAMENAHLLDELRARNDEIAGWNRELETRVADQLAELERTGKLRRFLAPQLADLIIAQGDEKILESHRREIVVVFCDIRGFTAFAERAEPEEVMALLRDYHAVLGPIVARFEGTLDHYSGDGVMVFFNDPLPTPEPAKRAIEMAVAMREAAQQVLKIWHRHGYDLGFGVGISQGYATLGQIGFAERMDYTAIGTVTNLAARLCSEAKDGQILISRRVAVAVEDTAKLEEIGEVSLKGLSQAVAIYNVVQ